MGEFDPMQLELTVVSRDRLWFQRYLPLFQKFISDLGTFKNSYTDYLDEIMPSSDKSPQRAKKRKIPDDCLVTNYDDLKTTKPELGTLQV
jgi:hypothetical protein